MNKKWVCSILSILGFCRKGDLDIPYSCMEEVFFFDKNFCLLPVMVTMTGIATVYYYYIATLPTICYLNICASQVGRDSCAGSSSACLLSFWELDIQKVCVFSTELESGCG